VKFKFGKTKDKHEFLENWHDWFAWYPVEIKMGYFAWLEVVERKITFVEEPMYPTVEITEYRLKQTEAK
jgi:hypothetical protein